jgi:hypothetical protein
MDKNSLVLNGGPQDGQRFKTICCPWPFLYTGLSPSTIIAHSHDKSRGTQALYIHVGGGQYSFYNYVKARNPVKVK